MTKKPFEGIRVVDFTQVVSGPYATFQLAALGAEVIKIERREGEDLRRTNISRKWSDLGLAPIFIALNSGKRGIALDLTKPEAVEIIRKLVAEADVVVENFRPGVMDRLGIGYRTLSEINSKIIYCAISAFGQTGPEREAAGYDGKIQALSGIMAMTGHESTGPTRAGFAVCDVISGSTAAFAIAAALRQRDQTGKGQFIDVSMLEASLAFMSSQVADYTIADHVEKLSGNYSISRKPTANLLKAGSGSLLFAVNNEKQFRALMTALGRPDVISDPRFSNWKTRKENEKALVEIIEECLATKSASDWEQLLDAAGAPCATVRRIDEILEHPQIRSREVLKTIDTPHGPLRLIATGFKLAHGDAEISSIAPGVGEHSAEVLEELGYSASEIAALAVSQII